MALNKVLKVSSDSELLSYIINVTPELASEIDLPKQGESILPIGKLIMNNARYKNAFINTVNIIGLTIIKNNLWDNPWNFTVRGTLRYGQQIREMIMDLCKVYDYNENLADKEKFLETAVPDVFSYMHEVNFQKYYETTTSEDQLLMAFEREGGLFDFIEKSIGMLYESLKYDTYIVDKYMLCKRIVDGTVTPVQITDYATITPRERVSAIKAVSNKMTFRNPNYNPAGVRRATKFEDQILIVNTEFEADFSTSVLATSFFKDEADMKARLVLIDGFSTNDEARLSELLGDAYVEFTDDELTYLATVPAVIVSREWFMDYIYALDGNGEKKTEFFNPTTLENNHFLHAWRVFSTSPFEQACVFTSGTPSITSVSVSPEEPSISAGLDLQLSATVVAPYFANKAVIWTVEEAPGEQTGSPVTVDLTGKVHIPSDYEPTQEDDAEAGTEFNPLIIRATSVYDDTVYGDATITVL